MLIAGKRLSARQIDGLVWPKATAMRDFATFRRLRTRFGITATLEKVTLAMQIDSFPRGYLFNDRVMWRVCDVQDAITDPR
jgi:hypothetical protein